MDTHAIDYACQEIRDTRHLVVFTGAGVSAASGIPTFRDSDGLWQEFPPDVFGSRAGLQTVARAEPRRLAAFIEAVLRPIAEAKPNAAHRAIASIGEHRKVTVVTQNIDGLHQDSGSEQVLEIHGSLLRVCNRSRNWSGRITRERLRQIVRRLARLETGPLVLPRLGMAVRGLAGIGFTGIYMPDLVLFGDSLSELDWTLANKAVETCDALIQVGTSGNVYPAALLPEIALDREIPVIDIDPAANLGISLRGNAEEILPRVAQELGKLWRLE